MDIFPIFRRFPAYYLEFFEHKTRVDTRKCVVRLRVSSLVASFPRMPWTAPYTSRSRPFDYSPPEKKSTQGDG